MGFVTYQEVVRLAEQLTVDDQRALVDHLQGLAQQRDLTFAEWKTLFDSLKSDAELVQDFSDRREDWYDDDGR